MKKINRIAGLLIIAAFSSCQDNLLESTPYGQPASDKFWRNADDVVAATNAIYAPLLDEDGFAHTEYTFDNCSDDMNPAGDHEPEEELASFTFSTSNTHILNTWSTKYEVISRANAVLINAPNVDMDDALRTRCMGEAYFLRGYIYWRLAIIYGEVPIIIEEDVLANNFNKAKSTLAEVQAQAESDFLNAAQSLPVSYSGSDVGRATQGAANGFLAKLYVYQEQWTKAIEAGNKVITNAAYKLADKYDDNFKIGTENNTEVLYALQYQSGWTTDNSPAWYHTPGGLGGWGFHEPIEDLVDEFEAGDPRLGYSIFSPGDIFNRGSIKDTFKVSDTRVTGYSFRKYSNFTDGGDMDQSLNAPLLRSADVYLLVAEAKIRSGGAGDGDAELNAVRARVELDPVVNATMTDIMHERRVELAGEMERHQDLMRWDKAGLIDIVAHYALARGPYKPGRTFVKPKHYYFPLPQREIDISNGILLQNQYYID